MKRSRYSKVGVIGATFVSAAVLAAGAGAAVVDTTLNVPTLDRWMYNFASTPGVETQISVFTSIGDPLQLNFDDHDGQFLVGFDTSGIVTPGLASNRYRILSATVIARNNRGAPGFVYDPTYDAWQTYLPTTDPLRVVDSDTGRPIELYMAGYRNGFSAASFGETSAFSVGDPTVLPQRGVRNVFAAQYDGNGSVQDVSNNILTGQFDSRPLAVGLATPTDAQPNAVAPGSVVPAWTDFTFNVDLTNPGAIRYLRESLAAGRLNLVITSVATSAQQGGSPPRFVSKENADPRAVPARLSLRVCVGPPADWDCNGIVNFDDIFIFLNDWFAGKGDFDASGVQTIDDIFIYLSAWFGS